MPPVRWKTLYILALSFQIWITVAAESNMQDPITMTSDGWRPIVGSRRPAPGFVSNHQPPSSQRVVEVEIVKSENPITITSTFVPEKQEIEQSTKPYNNLNAGPAQKTGNKDPPHSKFSSPKYQTLPPSAVALGRPSEFGLRKHPLKPLKPMGHLGPVQKRKPFRGQLGAQSNRNEVYVLPSGAITFPFIKHQGPSNIRTRETQGLGLFGSNGHFTVNQPTAHLEINRFPQLNNNVFEQYKSPGLAYIIPKLKKQPDEYSRNLVPPPPIRDLAEKEKLKNANSKLPTKFKDNLSTKVSEPLLEYHEQFGAKSPQIQENLVQIPVGFDPNYVLQKQFKPKPQSAIDVQVTKENLKVYHNILQNNFKPSAGEYFDYEYHGIPSPVQLPKLQTYEVTEGKWADNPNPYTFNYAKFQDQSQNFRGQPIGPPAQNPQITNEPIVELNLPPFLPTPYKPDPAYPTSPTQSEASTVFNQVSQKMNKFKTSVLANNPLFFDIKEVSTHYPILGRPEFIQETQTDSPAKENEIVNEVTTQMEELTTRKRRRRPQPRRPTAPTTSTTTTTEEPQQTVGYESQKTQEELSPETERPPKRQRQRPNRYRLPNSSTTSTTTSEYQESPVRYRTTTPSNEYEENSGEKKVRGRNRYRQRGKDQADYRTKDQNTEHRNILYRKRTRPTTTEMPPNHKLSEKDNSEQADNSNFESKYFQNVEVATRPQRIIEYEDGSLSLSDEDMSDVSYETTPAYNQLEDIRVKLQVGSRDHLATTSAPEETTVVISPENELDPTTLSPKPESDQGEPTQSTLATTIPTTTSTEAKTTTSRSSRIKTRPTLFKSNRPRFSVKDYRQRLTQQSSTTPSTTTDVGRNASDGSRFRFPSRLRTRPTYSTTVSQPQQEETTTELIVRRRFKPKEPRHSTEANNIISETNVKAVNTRLRPFDRYKTSTEPTPKTKVSIKPGFYTNRRRPTFSMKTKLVEKDNQTEDVTTKIDEVEEISKNEQELDKDVEVTTVYQSSRLTTTDVAPLTTMDISDDDYSQRISDLTSSFKTEYDTPGLFKSVAPISRRVPNYFTISTEDPILPIEAFFPGIKEKEKEKK